MKIKKILSAFVISSILLSVLTACKGTREIESTYIISALGFDQNGENLSLYAEAVVVSTEISNDDATVKIFNSSGQTVESAVFNLGSVMTKTAAFDHCGVIIIGDSIHENTLEEIYDFAKENININLGIEFIATASAEALLNSDATSALTVGYALMGLQKRSAKEHGINYKNKLYEINDSRYNNNSVYLMPYAVIENEIPKLYGAQLFYNCKKAERLNLNEMTVYSTLTKRINKEIQ